MSNAKKFFGLSSPFAERLKLLFFNSGETQEQAANRFNVTRQGFGNWLNGRTQPDYDALCKLAEYYHVSTDYLLGRTDAKTPDTSISGCTQLTGLSETSIRKLMELNEENRATWYGDVCNSIISNDNFTALVFYLTTLVTRRFSNKKLSEFNYGATVQEVYEGIVSNVFFRLTTDLKEEYKSKLETDCRDAYDLVYGLCDVEKKVLIIYCNENFYKF